ncbi:Uncharacterised protein [Bordetella pertussis]|nr:Uncharacterised protein [Bordetella pertussis]
MPCACTSSVGKFSTSSSPSRSGWSSMSIHAKVCPGRARASSSSLGRYCWQVSHQAAQKQATSQASERARAARRVGMSEPGTCSGIVGKSQRV